MQAVQEFRERYGVLGRRFAVAGDAERSSQALVALRLLTAMGLLPGVIEERAIELFTAHGHDDAAHVPGPREPLYLAGARIAQQFNATTIRFIFQESESWLHERKASAHRQRRAAQ